MAYSVGVENALLFVVMDAGFFHALERLLALPRARLSFLFKLSKQITQ
jgi:hypothetical protein